MQLLQIFWFFHLTICWSNICAVSVLGKGRVLILSLNTTTLSSEETSRNQNQSVTEDITLNLPKGFKPQPSPLNALLYPFVTEEVSSGDAATKNDATTSGWKPIVNDITSTQRSTTYIPLLQDRVSLTATESQQSKEEEGPFFQSVVYGTWKPDPPLEPDSVFDSLHKMINGHHESTTTNNSNSQESIEGRRAQPWLLKKPDEGKNSEKHTNKKYGRKKIPAYELDGFNRSGDTEYASINDSVEMVTVPNKEKPTRSVTNWTPIVPTIRQQEHPKIWPTDFKQTTTIPSEAEKSNYNFMDYSSEPLQALSGLNIPESLIPQIPVNITKMGVPYEDQNSAEEPRICVPLTVRETLNTAQILDVERVYCFPLPIPEIDVRTDRNDATMNANVNTLSDNETINSSNLEITNSKCSFILMSTLILLVKFFIS